MSKQYFKGKPIGYKISHYPAGFEENFSFVTVNYTTNSTELTNLTVFTEYVINVSAVSSGGVGPGISTTARTDANGRSNMRTGNYHGPKGPFCGHYHNKLPLEQKQGLNITVLFNIEQLPI